MQTLSITKYQAPCLQLVSINTSKNIKNASNVYRMNLHTNEKLTLSRTYWDNPDYLNVVNYIKARSNIVSKDKASRILSMILPYYFFIIIGRESPGQTVYCAANQFYTLGYDKRNREIRKEADYVVWKSDNSPLRLGDRVDHVIVSVFNSGTTWDIALLDSYKLCSNACDSNGKIWAIIQKGFEICVFIFNGTRLIDNTNLSKIQCYIPLNLDNLSIDDLVNLNLDFKTDYYNGVREIRVIQWKTDELRFVVSVNNQLIYVGQNSP